MAILISAHALNSRSSLAISVCLLLGALYFFTSQLHHRAYIPSNGKHGAKVVHHSPPARPHIHPIDTLIKDAEKEFAALMKKETHSLHDATKAYKKRRGRAPPPAFDLWHQFAEKQGSIIVEDFFDRIYDDLKPFWGASPNQLRNHANSAEFRIAVREQTVTTRMLEGRNQDNIEIWRQMIEDIIANDGWVPDVDLPMNELDETRVVAKWEDVAEHMMREAEGRKIVPDAQLINTFQRLDFLDDIAPGPIDPIYSVYPPYWALVTPGCPPMSPARHSYLDDHDYTHPPVYDNGFPDGSYYGFVQNWTFSRSLCDLPNVQSLMGSFIEPVTIAITSKLIPMFHSAKLSVNNEIILPSPSQWTDFHLYSGGEENPRPWNEKEFKVFWRGQGSGGRNRYFSWTHWHRHRFARMNNETALRLVANGLEDPVNFALPDNDWYDLAIYRGWDVTNNTLGDWVEKWEDVGLINLQCHPDDDPPHCEYSDPYFTLKDGTNGVERQWAAKYLPDIDGNTNSGRFRMLLNSNSVPIKSTMYHEWHDNRLVPWKHFVPMHSSYSDYYAIMDYFLGDADRQIDGHDSLAEKIAMSGKEWVGKALRKEDMLVYMYRLLLEWARLCHDNRYKMGWSEHLL